MKGFNLYNLAKFSKKSYSDAKESNIIALVVEVGRLYFDEDMLNALKQDGISTGDYLVVKINLGQKSDLKEFIDKKLVEKSNLPQGIKENAEPFKEFEIFSLSAEEYDSLKKEKNIIPYENKTNRRILNDVLENRKHIVNVDIAKKIYFSKIIPMSHTEELIKDNDYENTL